VKEASSITVDAFKYNGKDVVAYVGMYESGRIALAIGQAHGSKIYYGCIDPYHRCTEAWFKLRGVDFSTPSGGARLVAAWDIDNAVVCLEDGSACFWGRRNWEIRGGSLVEILPELQRVAPHIKVALARANEGIMGNVVVGIVADGVEVSDHGGEKRYYAAVPEKWENEILGWWIVYGRVGKDYGEACVIYDGVGAGRMLFGDCRVADEVELLASYATSGDYSVFGGRSVKRVRVKAIVEGGRVLAALFNDKTVVNNRVVKTKDALTQLNPRAATMFSRIVNENGSLVMYG